MRRPEQGKPLVLGVYPSCRGFGWIAFEGPFAAYDWGLVFVSRDKNIRSLAHFERLLDRLAPETVVLEVIPGGVRRTPRVATLQKAFVAAAGDRAIELAAYARGEVRTTFASAGARTRQEIAVAVARQLPALSHRLPRKRGPWHSEDRRMALFNAAAVVMTHFHLGASRLYEDLLQDA